MAKHLVDLDEAALTAARATLGTETIKDTVNQALQRTAAVRERAVRSALDDLAAADLEGREAAWR